MQELLQMVPQPVVAVMFLFPVTKESEAAKDTGTIPFLLQQLQYMLSVQVIMLDLQRTAS